MWHLAFLSNLFFTFRGNKSNFLHTDRNLTKKWNISQYVTYRNKFQLLAYSTTEHITENKSK